MILSETDKETIKNYIKQRQTETETARNNYINYLTQKNPPPSPAIINILKTQLLKAESAESSAIFLLYNLGICPDDGEVYRIDEGGEDGNK